MTVWTIFDLCNCAFFFILALMRIMHCFSWRMIKISCTCATWVLLTLTNMCIHFEHIVDDFPILVGGVPDKVVVNQTEDEVQDIDVDLDKEIERIVNQIQNQVNDSMRKDSQINIILIPRKEDLSI